ncbi:MAG: hypothetical protein ACK5QX_02565, partial [bacterium]
RVTRGRGAADTEMTYAGKTIAAKDVFTLAAFAGLHRPDAQPGEPGKDILGALWSRAQQEWPAIRPAQEPEGPTS